MRHAKKRLQLNRFTSWHKATLKSLSKNLLVYQSIKTTETKAKATRPLIEKLISLAKKNTLAAKRFAFRTLGDHQLVSLLFNEIGPRFKDRDSGFCRLLHLGRRRGDNARMVIFELTEIKKKEPKKLKKEKEAKPEEEKKAPPEKEKPPVAIAQEKPTRKIFRGIRGIFKKERDAL